ncbi:GNAT family N-acetyltransferase [Mycobacterium botniense]|nr:GNAT family N-acetyltransferase [Mycobacterium botniense]
MDVIDLPNYGPAQRDQILGGEHDAWGADSLGLVWRDQTGHVGVVADGRLIAHAGWLPVELRIDERPLQAVGLGAVLVNRTWRGRGVGRVVVQAAQERMRQMGRPFGLLFCRQGLVRFYETLGWHPVADEVIVDQPDGPVTMPLRTCWLPLHDDAQLPAGRVVVEGFPF